MKNILVLIWSTLLLATSAYAQGGKQAILFVDPDVTGYESAFQRPRVAYDRYYYESLGYTVVEQIATEENIVAALLDGETRAISFFGHGNGPDAPGATSTMLFLNSAAWRARVYQEMRKRLAAAGVPKAEAIERAEAAADNFNLDIMKNHACSSLIDVSLAEKFVRGGGIYFGSPALYQACPSPDALFSDTSWRLEEYRVPFIATRDMRADPTAPGGPCAQDYGPAAGCIPGTDGSCIPCPGDDIQQWYEPITQ